MIARAIGDTGRGVSRRGKRYAAASISGASTSCDVELWADGHGSLAVRGEYGDIIAELAWPAESATRDAPMRAAVLAAREAAR